MWKSHCFTPCASNPNVITPHLPLLLYYEQKDAVFISVDGELDSCEVELGSKNLQLQGIKRGQVLEASVEFKDLISKDWFTRNMLGIFDSIDSMSAFVQQSGIIYARSFRKGRRKDHKNGPQAFTDVWLALRKEEAKWWDRLTIEIPDPSWVVRMNLSQVAKVLSVPDINKYTAPLVGLSQFWRKRESVKTHDFVQEFSDNSDSGNEMVETSRNIKSIPTLSIRRAGALPNPNALKYEEAKIQTLDHDFKISNDIKMDFYFLSNESGEGIRSSRIQRDLKVTPLKQLKIGGRFLANGVSTCSFQLPMNEDDKIWKDVPSAQSLLLGVCGIALETPPKALPVTADAYMLFSSEASNDELNVFAEGLLKCLSFDTTTYGFRLFWWRPVRAAILQSISSGQTAVFIAPRNSKTAMVAAISEAFNVMCCSRSSLVWRELMTATTRYPTASDLADKNLQKCPDVYLLLWSEVNVEEAQHLILKWATNDFIASGITQLHLTCPSLDNPTKTEELRFFLHPLVCPSAPFSIAFQCQGRQKQGRSINKSPISTIEGQKLKPSWTRLGAVSYVVNATGDGKLNVSDLRLSYLRVQWFMQQLFNLSLSQAGAEQVIRKRSRGVLSTELRLNNEIEVLSLPVSFSRDILYNLNTIIGEPTACPRDPETLQEVVFDLIMGKGQGAAIRNVSFDKEAMIIARLGRGDISVDSSSTYHLSVDLKNFQARKGQTKMLRKSLDVNSAIAPSHSDSIVSKDDQQATDRSFKSSAVMSSRREMTAEMKRNISHDMKQGINTKHLSSGLAEDPRSSKELIRASSKERKSRVSVAHIPKAAASEVIKVPLRKAGVITRPNVITLAERVSPQRALYKRSRIPSRPRPSQSISYRPLQMPKRKYVFPGAQGRASGSSVLAKSSGSRLLAKSSGSRLLAKSSALRLPAKSSTGKIQIARRNQKSKMMKKIAPTNDTKLSHSNQPVDTASSTVESFRGNGVKQQDKIDMQWEPPLKLSGRTQFSMQRYGTFDVLERKHKEFDDWETASRINKQDTLQNLRFERENRSLSTQKSEGNLLQRMRSSFWRPSENEGEYMDVFFEKIPFALEDEVGLNWNARLMEVYETRAEKHIVRLNVYRASRTGNIEACIQAFVTNPPSALIKEDTNQEIIPTVINPETQIPPLKINNSKQGHALLLFQLTTIMNGRTWDRNLRLQQMLREVCALLSVSPDFKKLNHGDEETNNGQAQDKKELSNTSLLRFAPEINDSNTDVNVQVSETMSLPLRHNDKHLNEKLRSDRLHILMRPLLAGVKFKVVRSPNYPDVRGRIVPIWVPLGPNGQLVILNTATGKVLIIPPIGPRVVDAIQTLAIGCQAYLSAEDSGKFFQCHPSLDGYPVKLDQEDYGELGKMNSLIRLFRLALQNSFSERNILLLTTHTIRDSFLDACDRSIRSEMDAPTGFDTVGEPSDPLFRFAHLVLNFCIRHSLTHHRTRLYRKEKARFGRRAGRLLFSLGIVKQIKEGQMKGNICLQIHHHELGVERGKRILAVPFPFSLASTEALCMNHDTFPAKEVLLACKQASWFLEKLYTIETV